MVSTTDFTFFLLTIFCLLAFSYIFTILGRLPTNNRFGTGNHLTRKEKLQKHERLSSSSISTSEDLYDFWQTPKSSGAQFPLSQISIKISINQSIIKRILTKLFSCKNLWFADFYEKYRITSTFIDAVFVSRDVISQSILFLLFILIAVISIHLSFCT